jgi:hypothetical protein
MEVPIMQYMSFLSPADKVVCRSVCKKWFVAARHVLEDQEEITLCLYEPLDFWKKMDVIGSKYRQDICFTFIQEPERGKKEKKEGEAEKKKTKEQEEEEVARFRESVVIQRNKTAANIATITESAIRMLGHFNRLKTIRSACFEAKKSYKNMTDDTSRLFRQSFEKVVDSLISSNSKSLATLTFHGNRSLPLFAEGFVYDQLKELKCPMMTEDDCSMIPKLRKLTVTYPNSSLEHLPIETMVELNLYNTSFPLGPGQDARTRMTRLLRVVPRLVNLKVLRIGNRKPAPAFPSDTFRFKTVMLMHHRQLEIVSFMFDQAADADGKQVHEDGVVHQLVRTNPNIREINNLYLTKSGIRCLSSLPNLRIVNNLRVTSRDQIVPMLMILLTGNSRHCIRHVVIGVGELLLQHELEDEANAVLLESALPFVASVEFTKLFCNRNE